MSDSPALPYPQDATTWPRPTPSDAPTQYVLVVEQTVGNSDRFWWTVRPEPVALTATTRAQAREAALDLARRFEPENPWRKLDRTILRQSEDSFIVVIHGATKAFHFRVSVAEQVG